MVVDASAVLAITLHEDDAHIFEDALARAGGGLMSSINFWEVLVRMQRLHGAEAIATADRFVKSSAIEITAPDKEIAVAAALAFARFGRRSAGRLNLGDCFAYALAAREGDGLLFKREDFPKTDVLNALGR